MKRLFVLIVAASFLMFPLPSQAEQDSINLKLKGLSCPFCVYGVEKKLKKVPGIENVTTHYKASMANLKKVPKTPIDINALYKAVKDAGFSLDSVILTIHGNMTEWEGKPAIKSSDSGQVFLLVDPDKIESHALVDSTLLKKLKLISKNNKQPITVKGKAHTHKDMPPAIAVSEYRKAP